MFNPFLTTESAFEALGEVENSADLSLDHPHHPVILFIRSALQIAIQGCNLGILTQDLQEKNPSDPSHQLIANIREEMAVNAARAVESSLIRGSTLKDARSQRTTQLYDDRYLMEPLYNALEHGTDFGSNGTVKVSAFSSQRGVLWFIEQSAGQEKFLKAVAPLLDDKSAVERTTLGNGIKREEGLYQLISSKNVQFSFEPLPNDGLRVIVFKSFGESLKS